MHFVQWHETPNYWIKSGINDPCKIDVFLCKILWFYNFLLKVHILIQMNENPLLNIKIILFLNFTLAVEKAYDYSNFLFKKTIDFPLIEFKVLLIIPPNDAMRGLKKKIRFNFLIHCPDSWEPESFCTSFPRSIVCSSKRNYIFYECL